jgi:hypothetical protein
MPDLLSLGLGAGTMVRDAASATTMGPARVRYRLTEQALVFGGDVLTVPGGRGHRGLGARRVKPGAPTSPGQDGARPITEIRGLRRAVSRSCASG